jgi:CRISPR/Cas system-associated exonuclease Cas4 (RecB family)
MKSIIEMINEGTKYLAEKEKPHIVGIYYPSSIFSCLRQSYFSYLEMPIFGLESLKAFSIGNAFHDLVQKSLKEYGDRNNIIVNNELSDLHYDTPTFSIHGRLDVFMLVEGKEKHIIEIKSHSDLRYLGAEGLESHKAQLNYYLHFFPDAEGHLLYINKAHKKMDDLNYKNFRVYNGIKYNEELFGKMVSRAEKLDYYLKNKELPPAEAIVDGEKWQCFYCPFKEKCYKMERR